MKTKLEIKKILRISRYCSKSKTLSSRKVKLRLDEKVKMKMKSIFDLLKCWNEIYRENREIKGGSCGRGPKRKINKFGVIRKFRVKFTKTLRKG